MFFIRLFVHATMLCDRWFCGKWVKPTQGKDHLVQNGKVGLPKTWELTSSAMSPVQRHSIWCFPVGFQSCFGSSFPFYSPALPFPNRNVSSPCHWVFRGYACFFTLWRLTVKSTLSLKEFVNNMRTVKTVGLLDTDWIHFTLRWTRTFWETKV